jgi:chromosome segregation ATPase
VYDPTVRIQDHKNYGFLEKSDRFVKGKHNLTLVSDDKIIVSQGPDQEHGREKEITMVEDKKQVEVLQKQLIRMNKEWQKKEDLLKMKATSLEKELVLLNEKYSKLESSLQTTVKERNTLTFQLNQKQKEIQELLHVQDSLKQRVSFC